MASITKYPVIIDDSEYVNTLDEDIYNDLMEVFYDSGRMVALTTKGKKFDSVGKDSFCVYEELFAIQEFIRLLVIKANGLQAMECQIVDGTPVPLLKDDADIKCAREMFICKFGSTSDVDFLIDELIQTAQLNGEWYIDEDGDDYILEDGDICSRYILEK